MKNPIVDPEIKSDIFPSVSWSGLAWRLQYYSIVPYRTVLYRTVWYYTVLLSALYCVQAGKEEDLLEKEVKKLMSMSDSDPDFQMVARYCTVLYCTVLYCTVLYCTVLYCTVLYCTVSIVGELLVQWSGS